MEILKYKPHLTVRKNTLYIEDVSTLELAEKFGTPLYVYSENRIKENYKKIYNSFKKFNVEIRYACKANSNISILKILKSLGSGLDVVSVGEIYLGILAGFDSEKIIYTGVNRGYEEIDFAVQSGVILNLDSVSELNKLIKICEKRKKKVKVSFRVNPEVDPKTHEKLATGLKFSKFGLHEELAFKAYKIAKENKYLDVAGVHMHIGSQITSVEPYKEAFSKLIMFVKKLKKDLNIELDFIDMGGGIGIVYKPGQDYIEPKDVADVINIDLDYDPKLLIEPGRYIVGDAGIVLTRVTTVKKTPYKKFVGVDMGFNVLLRPAMYNAYHEVLVANKAEEERKEVFDIAGNLCESGDIIARERRLPDVEEGDILAILDAGAYGYVMSSNYNSMLKPAEVLVNGKDYYLIRERDNLSDLVSKQIIPKHLLRC